MAIGRARRSADLPRGTLGVVYLVGGPTRRALRALNDAARPFRHIYEPPKASLNIGTGGLDRPGWINIDETKPGDILARVPPLPCRTGSVEEIYLGHVLEHLEKPDGVAMLHDCHRVLRPGGRITVVVPDMKAVAAAYLVNAVSNRELNEIYAYSYVQESHHRWCYDRRTLRSLLQDAGFVEIRRSNRWTEPRIQDGAWDQTGLFALKP